MMCVLSDMWALRCMMFILCVEEGDWGMMAFVALFTLGFQNRGSVSAPGERGSCARHAPGIFF